MAVSGKTTVNEIPYFLSEDKPPDMGTVTKAMADRLEVLKWSSRNLKPTNGSRSMTGESDLVLTSSFVTPSGLSFEITPAIESILHVWCYFELEITTGPAELLGTMKESAGTEETNMAVLTLPSTGRIVVPMKYRFTLTAAKHTMEARAKFASGKGTLHRAGTRFDYLLLAA